MSGLTIGVFMGSVREGRVCQRVTNLVTNNLNQRKHKVVIFDPKTMQLPLINKPLHWYKPNETIPSELKEIGDKIQSVDAFVLVSGEYNHTIPPALTNFMGHFGYSHYLYKPSALVTYSVGPIGGARGTSHLRALTGELGCISVPSIVSIGEAHKTIEEDGTPKDESILKRLNFQFNQLEWYANAMKNHLTKARM